MGAFAFIQHAFFLILQAFIDAHWNALWLSLSA
jgi:hypothetical protein